MRTQGQFFSIIAVAGIIVASAQFCGCASKKAPEQAVSTAPAASYPGASIQVTYAHPHDYVDLLTVTEYTGAHTVATQRRAEGKSVSLVRMDSGHILWVIKANRSNFSTRFPRLGKLSRFAVKEVRYGQVPKDFLQIEPPNDVPPQILVPERYYVFSVERGSGSVSYFLTKGRADGKLVGFDAEPLAGDSFELCCNVTAGFIPQDETAAAAEQNADTQQPAP